MPRPRLTGPRACKDCGQILGDEWFRDASETCHRACHPCRLPQMRIYKREWYEKSKAAKEYQREYRRTHLEAKRVVNARYRLRVAREHWEAFGHAFRRGESGCRICAQAKVAA